MKRMISVAGGGVSRKADSYTNARSAPAAHVFVNRLSGNPAHGGRHHRFLLPKRLGHRQIETCTGCD